MGYYISFMFDPSKIEFNRKKLIAQFLEAGALEFVDESWSGKVKEYFYNGYPLSFGECNQKALMEGYYADVRFSWSSEPEELMKDISALLDLADRLDCKLYDGQIDVWITRENVESIAVGFSNTASSITKLFGTVDKQKYMEEAGKVMNEKIEGEKESN